MTCDLQPDPLRFDGERSELAGRSHVTPATLEARHQYARAEPMYVEALDIRRRVLGADPPDTATSINNLAGLYESMGEYARAAPLLRCSPVRCL